jgi:putative tricarboxylic transport membrane protein
MVKDLVRNGEAISGAVLAALGTYIFVQSRAYDYYTADGPGPGFFPTWYGVAMVVLSLALIVTSIRKGGGEDRPRDWRGISRALLTWAAFAASVALMGTLGFVVSFALLTFCVVIFVFKRSLLTAGLTAVGAALVFHVVFPVILEVQLPTGLLGF